ncbi:hypothetical protein G5B38_01640 [Pseudohalocynthiibacter aestuariivivens]|uniref:Uncharacterized protein n=1 Tax=Roseovarius pelagicus TaxID=2980108 RepID=A0ABY6DC74_9RHOB|nr:MULTISPECIES: hypothetical protein [Rhodobacterales]QIE44338.1 hypothetical protein G5B38_01640 [Pseudohalocynthiibacter aestuariivivens]UXX83746.1 hypothetical protein N7U68_03505 [Roseovarius pelagicus]
MKLTILCATTILMTAAAPLWADVIPAPLRYEQFEAAIPHMDLETCPELLAEDDVFCRATLQHEEIHVFAFSTQGDNPLVSVTSFSAEGMTALLTD